MDQYFELDKLEKVCDSFKHKHQKLSDNELLVFLNKEIKLKFINLIEEKETYIGFDTGDHVHGMDIEFTFFIGETFHYYCVNYLDLIPCLHRGDLFIRSLFKDGKLTERYFLYKIELDAINPNKILLGPNCNEFRITKIP